jgi:hypothetical protein
MWHAAPDRHLPEIPRVLEGVPKDVARVVQRLVAKDPAQRYASADEALSDLNVDIKLVKTGPAETVEDDEPAPQTETAGGDRKRLAIVIGAFAVSVLLSIGILFMPDGTNNDGGPIETTVGVVREIDPDAKEIVFEHLLSRRPEILHLGESPTILLLRLGEPEQFILPRDIEPGDWLEIENMEDSGSLVQLTVSRPAESTGRIRSVNTAEHRVTVAVTEGAIRDEVVMNVPERAEVLINNDPADLRELREDDAVRVRHLLDPARNLGHVVSRLSAFQRHEFSAYIEEVDLEEKVLHLAHGPTGSRIDVFPLASGAEIMMRTGEPIELSALRQGDRVTVTADVLIYSLVVTREGQILKDAVITDIDPAARQLGVRDAERQRRVFQVPTDAEITLQLERVELPDLRPEIDRATVTYSEGSDGVLTAGAVDARRGMLHDRWGLVIGTQAYNDLTLSALRYATADAQLVEETLRKRYALDPGWSSRLLDQNRGEAREAVQDHLARVGSGHQLIVYVAGHAYLGPDNVVYLAFKDFRFDDMPGTGLPLDWLVEQIEGCKADEKLLLLDLVHAGSGRDLDRQPSLPDLIYQLKTPIHSVDIIGSAGAGQRGSVLPAERQGAFAHFVARGFAGEADADRDLVVTGDELETYLKAQFAEVSLPGGVEQGPFRMEPPSANGE